MELMEMKNYLQIYSVQGCGVAKKHYFPHRQSFEPCSLARANFSNFFLTIDKIYINDKI